MSKTDEIAFVTTDQENPSHYHVDPDCPHFPNAPQEIMDTSDLLQCSDCVREKSPAERQRDRLRGESNE